MSDKWRDKDVSLAADAYLADSGNSSFLAAMAAGLLSNEWAAAFL